MALDGGDVFALGLVVAFCGRNGFGGGGFRFVIIVVSRDDDFGLCPLIILNVVRLPCESRFLQMEMMDSGYFMVWALFTTREP